jgi:hypothetical protein
MLSCLEYYIHRKGRFGYVKVMKENITKISHMVKTRRSKKKREGKGEKKRESNVKFSVEDGDLSGLMWENRLPWERKISNP